MTSRSVSLLTAAMLCAAVQPTAAQESEEPDYYIGQVIMFAGNFCPQGFLPANGQILPISQYVALGAILGNAFGGDGQTTFALPNMAPVPTLENGRDVTLCISYDGVFPARPGS